MTENELISRIIALFSGFLSGQIAAREMIRQFEDMMAEEFDYESESPRMKIIDEFHTELALFVDDPVSRRDSALYYGPEELRLKLELFLSAMRGPNLN